MGNGLDQLNAADVTSAESTFRDCCGSRRWAASMAAARPFASETELLAAAAATWAALGPQDQLEAFAAHPKIGESKTPPAQQARSADWSRGEQSLIGEADDRVRHDLAEANRLYLEKFGYIYIVCATGRTAAEMLDICRRRLANSPDTELAFAAAEQQKITEIRLRKILAL